MKTKAKPKSVQVFTKIHDNSELVCLVKNDIMEFPVRIGSRKAHLIVTIQYYETNTGKREVDEVMVESGKESANCRACDLSNNISCPIRYVVSEMFEGEHRVYRKQIVDRVAAKVVQYCREEKIIGVRK